MKNFPKSRQQNIVVQRLNGELLIYDLSLNKAFCLNHASALVWEACDGEKSITEITKVVGKQLNTEINEDYVWLALSSLKKEKLITNVEEIPSVFNGLTRRQIIKRIGFSSMVAIPIVTSLVAPSAVHAQSGNCMSCSCSGLVGAVTTCPQGTSNCSPGCQFCNIVVEGCFSGPGGTTCNGNCSTEGSFPVVCPPSSPGDCTCGTSAPCSTVQCPGGCTTCMVTAPCFLAPDTNINTCPGICQ